MTLTFGKHEAPCWGVFCEIYSYKSDIYVNYAQRIWTVTIKIHMLSDVMERRIESDFDRLVADATAHHRAGHLSEAEAAYRAVLGICSRPRRHHA